MKRLPVIGVVFFFFLTLIPYYIYSSGQLLYFLQPFQEADPALWSRDWFVTHAPNLNGFFGWMVARIYPLGNLPLFLFLLHLTQFFFLVTGIFYLTGIFSKDIRIPLLVSACLLFYFSDGLGQSDIYSAGVQPNDIAIVFYLFSLVFLFQDRILLTWVFLGLAGLFHVQIYLQGSFIFLAYRLLAKKPWNLSRMGVGGVISLFLASPTLIPILQDFSPADPLGSNELFRLLYNFRGPHHYRPSVFELSHSFRILFPLAFLIFPGEMAARNKASLKAAQSYIGILLALCLLATLSTEWFFLPFIASQRFFRLSPFLLLIGLIFLSQRLVEETDKKNALGFLLSGVTLTLLFLEKDSRLFVPLSLFLAGVWAFKDKIESRAVKAQRILFRATWVTVPLLLYLAMGRGGELIFNASLGLSVLFLLRLPWQRPFSQAFLAALLLGIPAFGFHFIHPERVFFHPLQIAPRPPLFREQPALEETLDWIREHTEKEALFLSPPYQDGIRFFSQRALVVDYHFGPYRSRDLKEWKERLEAVTQTSGLEKWRPTTDDTGPQRKFLRRGYLNLKASEVEKIAQVYRADYFLTESVYPEKKALLGRGQRLVFENSSYLVFRLKGVSSRDGSAPPPPPALALRARTGSPSLPAPGAAKSLPLRKPRASPEHPPL